MTDLSPIRALAYSLVTTVGTTENRESLKAFERAGIDLRSTDPDVSEWLIAEHIKGEVLSNAMIVAASMSASTQQVMMTQYVQWAIQLVERIDSVRSGTRTVAEMRATADMSPE